MDAKTNLYPVEMVMDPSGPGSVRVLLFAALRDQAGWGERVMPLESADQTALDLWHALNLGPWSSAVRVAVNQTLVAPDQPVAAGDELAFLPPFTGG